MSDRTQIENSILYGFDQQPDGSFARIFKPVEYTPITLAIHERVHEGRFFSGGYYATAVADASVINMLVQVGTQLETHANIYVVAGGDALYQIYEDTTFSAAGTPINISNHNRNSSKMLDAIVTHTPTITGDGNQVNGTTYLAGGQKSRATGGILSLSEEIVLKPSTNYLFRLTNISGLSKNCNIIFAGYQPYL